MAGPLNWTSEALEDIDAIADFIARDSPRHAKRIIEALFELGDVIEVHPFAGRGSAGGWPYEPARALPL
jgi:plasmid stabilization system protein ParE